MASGVSAAFSIFFLQKLKNRSNRHNPSEKTESSNNKKQISYVKFKWLRLAVAVYVLNGYFTFAKPFKWNFKTGLAEVVKSKWSTRIRILLTALTVMSTASQIFTITRDLAEERIPPTEFTTLFRIGAALYCGFFTLLQLHTALRADSIQDFVNHALKYLYIMEKHGVLESPKKFDRKCGIILLSLFVWPYITVASAFSLFWAQCEYHILSNVLPICEESLSSDTGEIVWIHRSFPWRIVYLSLCVIILLQHAAANLYYIAMVTVPVLGCSEVLQKMRESTVQTEGTRNPFFKSDKLLLHYQCLQMLFNRINITLGRHVFPVGIFILLIILILSNFGAIAMSFQYYELLGVPGYIAIVIFFVTIIRQGVFFSDISKEVIERKRADCCSDREIFALQLRTCRPLRVTCGGFFYLERLTLLKMLGNVIDYTVQFLITYSTA